MYLLIFLKKLLKISLLRMVDVHKNGKGFKLHEHKRKKENVVANYCKVYEKQNFI